MWNRNAPQGRTLARFSNNLWSLYPILVALGVKIWLDLLEGYGVMGVLRSGSLVTPKFSAPLAAKLCIRPQKLKFLLRFDQNVEYERPAGEYPLCDFHQICSVCTTFQDALGIKTLLDLLKGLWSYGGFKLRGSGFPQIFSAPLAAKLCVRPPNERTCSRSAITMPSLVRLGFHPPPGWRKTLKNRICSSLRVVITGVKHNGMHIRRAAIT